jgi:hypothetical protein
LATLDDYYTAPTQDDQGASTGALQPRQQTGGTTTGQQRGPALAPGYGYGMGMTDPLYALSATDTSALAPQDYEPSDTTKSYFKASQALMGNDPAGRFQDLADSRDKAAQQKMAAIERAMTNLQNVGQQQTVNLPLLAAAAGMLAPTRTGGFGESVGNAMREAVPALGQQRQMVQERALQQARLGIEEGSIPSELSQEQMQDYLKQLQVGEQYGQTGARLQSGELIARARERASELGYQGKVGSAAITAQGRVDSASVLADRGRFAYIGPNPADQNEGVYLDKNTGTTHFGAAALGKGLAPADTAQIRTAKSLQMEYAKPENGRIKLTFPDAYGMTRAGVNNPHQWVSEVQAAQRLITTANPAIKPDQALEMARDQVTKLHEQQKQQQSGGTPQAPAPAPAQPGAAPAVAPGNQGAQGALRRATDPELAAARAALQGVRSDGTKTAPADRAAVEQRLREHGIDPTGL